MDQLYLLRPFTTHHHHLPLKTTTTSTSSLPVPTAVTTMFNWFWHFTTGI
ncbi:hypothetical protein Hdeb2414_s0008g00292981 [Helianthus debilis subsp. tardiflorus]